MDVQSVWAIVNLGLSGITSTPLFIIWCVSFCVARRKDDHSRVGFSWMQAVFPFQIANIVCRVLSDATVVAYYSYGPEFSSIYQISPNSEDAQDFLQVSERAASVSGLFSIIANTLLMVAIVELLNGFLFIRQGLQRTATQQRLRYGAIALAVVLLALALGSFGELNAMFTYYFNTTRNFNQEQQEDAFLRQQQKLQQSYATTPADGSPPAYPQTAYVQKPQQGVGSYYPSAPVVPVNELGSSPVSELAS